MTLRRELRLRRHRVTKSMRLGKLSDGRSEKVTASVILNSLRPDINLSNRRSEQRWLILVDQSNLWRSPQTVRFSLSISGYPSNNSKEGMRDVAEGDKEATVFLKMNDHLSAEISFSISLVSNDKNFRFQRNEI